MSSDFTKNVEVFNLFSNQSVNFISQYKSCVRYFPIRGCSNKGMLEDDVTSFSVSRKITYGS